MQPATLDIEQQSSGNGLLIARLKGKLSLETVSGFLQQLRPIDSAKLVLDMSGVSFLDSAGVGALVQIFVHRRVKSQSFALAARTPQGHPRLPVARFGERVPKFPPPDQRSP